MRADTWSQQRRISIRSVVPFERWEGPNLYEFVGTNAVAGYDPAGLWTFTFGYSFTIGMGLGFTVGFDFGIDGHGHLGADLNFGGGLYGIPPSPGIGISGSGYPTTATTTR